VLDTLDKRRKCGHFAPSLAICVWSGLLSLQLLISISPAFPYQISNVLLSHSLTVPSLASRHLVNTLRFSIDGRRLELDCNNLRSHNHHGVRTALVQLTPAPFRSTKLIPVAIAWEPRYFQSHNICGMVEMLHFLTYSGHPNIPTLSFSRDTATCQRLRTPYSRNGIHPFHNAHPPRSIGNTGRGGEQSRPLEKLVPKNMRRVFINRSSLVRLATWHSFQFSHHLPKGHAEEYRSMHVIAISLQAQTPRKHKHKHEGPI
jgi:hypothetical protein